MTKLEFNSEVIEHTQSLRVYALHFTRDHEDADDLVQDTVLKAVTYYAKFREGTNLKGWLYTIMKNTFINKYRKFVKTNHFVTKSEVISSHQLAYSATRNGGEDKFIMTDIKRALSRLSEDYYVPFSMYFEGFKYHEISEHLEIPIGTVKTRIHMARKMLKRNLLDYVDQPR